MPHGYRGQDEPSCNGVPDAGLKRCRNQDKLSCGQPATLPGPVISTQTLAGFARNGRATGFRTRDQRDAGTRTNYRVANPQPCQVLLFQPRRWQGLRAMVVQRGSGCGTKEMQEPGRTIVRLTRNPAGSCYFSPDAGRVCALRCHNGGPGPGCGPG